MELEENGKIPFLGMEIIRNSTWLDKKVYRKPTDTGLLLHYYSHVDMKYKHSLLRTMLNRAFKFSSTWQFFHQECERLKEIFTRLHYPEPLIQNTIRLFVEMKVTGSKRPPQQAGEIPVRIPLPFKDQRSANKLREQLSDLSRKIKTEVHPVFTSHKIKDELKAKEPKPPIVKQQNVVYFFKCDLCDADYVGYTSRHLHQRVEEHKRSVIGNHVREQHGNEPCEIAKNFRVLRKCSNKFDCLIFEMFLIRDLKPKLNKQSDSIRAKLFV